ncbi:MAG: biosynthetic-type acetolactate synthase large subunit [Balneolaceae bacterium]|nr:biosynthetic-type acetolactate synthase large subunit [Balneolaceae bacterium]
MNTIEAPSKMETKSTKTTERVTGADAVVRILLQEGVDLVFGYPGGAIMPVYDSLYDYQDKIHHVLARHEQGATHAAQGYARASGKVGVCLATSGPGATNLITGLADAQIDSTPMVCITGQVPSALLGSDAFQETDVIGISMPVTKWNTQVTRAEEIPEALAKAFYIAKSGRPGPVLVDITKDAQFQEFDFNYEKCTGLRSYVPVPELDQTKVQEAADLINNAERPYILFGQGVILGNAEKEFKTFIEKTGIPSAWTIMGLSALETDHPLNVGMLGMHGNYGPNLLTNECDVLIAIGMRFDDRVTGNLDKYAKQAKVIHLEIDPAEIDKNVNTDVAVLGDCKESLTELTKLVEPKSHDKWLQRFRDCDAMEQEKVIQNELHPTTDLLSMGEVIRIINEKTNGDAILVTDVGQHQMVACRYTKFNQSKSNITSGGLGTMGFGLPAGLGAALGAPDRTVVTVIGDGGLQMTIQEFATIYQTRAKVKVLLLNNEFLGMVRQWQQLFFDKRYSATEMINPDFQTIAKGYHIPTNKVTERDKLDEAITEFINHDGAYFLEVMVGKENNVFPMVPSGSGVAEIRLE